MKTRPLLIILTLMIAPATLAQPIVTEYVHTIGGTSFDEGADVDVDLEGNAYFTGIFRGTFDFDSGPGITELTSISQDVYVVSYDPSGNVRFAFRLGDAIGGREGAGAIAVDDDGTSYVTGRQPFGPIDFDPDPVGDVSRQGKLFLASYDDDGDFRFVVAPEGVSGTPTGSGNAVALDAAGNVYVAGGFTGTIDFDPEATTPALLTSSGSSDIFVAGYTSDGDYRFAFSLGGVGADQALGVAADALGNVYITGNYSDVVSFDPSDSDGDGDTEDRNAATDGELFIASYSAAGDFRFVYTPGAAGSVGYDAGVDAANNLYVTGEFHGTQAFDPDDSDGDGNVENRTAEGNGSAFLVSYTSDGVFRFATAYPGGTSTGAGLDVAGSGITFMTGTFAGTIDIDPGAGVSNLASGDGTDVFVTSHDPDGALRGGFAFGGNGLNTGHGIGADPLGTVAVTGEFTNTTDFDPDPATQREVASGGQNDAFLASYSYEPISILPPPPPGCPDGLYMSDFDADQGAVGDEADDFGEFIAIEHLADLAVSLDDCALVFFDAMSERSYFSMQLAGSLDAGGAHLVGNAGVPGVDQTFPDATLQNGPDAITILDRSAASVPNGTQVANVVNDVVASVIYISDDIVFAQLPAVAKHAGDLPSLLKEAAAHEAPASFALEANYPNPFNPLTIIPFSIAEDVQVKLEVFDVTGRLISTLINGPMAAGTYRVEWNGRNLAGHAAAGGAYVYRLSAGRYSHARGMLLVK